VTFGLVEINKVAIILFLRLLPVRHNTFEPRVTLEKAQVREPNKSKEFGF